MERIPEASKVYVDGKEIGTVKDGTVYTLSYENTKDFNDKFYEAMRKGEVIVDLPKLKATTESVAQAMQAFSQGMTQSMQAALGLPQMMPGTWNQPQGKEDEPVNIMSLVKADVEQHVDSEALDDCNLDVGTQHEKFFEIKANAPLGFGDATWYYASRELKSIIYATVNNGTYELRAAPRFDVEKKCKLSGANKVLDMRTMPPHQDGIHLGQVITARGDAPLTTRMVRSEPDYSYMTKLAPNMEFTLGPAMTEAYAEGASATRRSMLSVDWRPGGLRNMTVRMYEVELDPENTYSVLDLLYMYVQSLASSVPSTRSKSWCKKCGSVPQMPQSLSSALESLNKDNILVPITIMGFEVCTSCALTMMRADGQADEYQAEGAVPNF